MNTTNCSPKIAISHFLQTGRNHQSEDLPCQDTVLIRNTEDCLFCGLADGQTGTRYGAEGGHACLEAIADYIDSIGIHDFIHTPFPDELPCMLVQTYRRKLLPLAQTHQADLKEFASTLLAIAVERKTGNYALLHLGDGCAVSIPRTGDPSLLTQPDNGLTLKHTWLTTNPGAVSHFRVCFGSLESKKRLILLSDGAACFCRGSTILWRVKDLLKQGTPEQLREKLVQSTPIDDTACILLEISNL